MPALIEPSNTNEQIKRIIRAYNVQPPCQFWIGDIVYFTPTTKNNVIDKYGWSHWDHTIDGYIKNNKSELFQIIAITKYKAEEWHLWWFLCKSNDGSDFWLSQEALIPDKPQIPDYKPKKFDRTLEARNSMEEANEITILIKNVEEFDLLYDVMKEFGYVIYDSFRTAVEKSNEPINIFINLSNGEITQTTLSYWLGQWTKSPVYSGVWEKELTIKDLPQIEKILKYKKISYKPSYEPKKFIRRIDESPDESSYINDRGEREDLWYKDDGAYGFGYYKDIMYLSPEKKGHGSMGPEDERKTKFFNRKDFTYPGRIWTHEKVMSFWDYPDKEYFQKILIDLSDLINIHFDDPEWKVEILNDDDKYVNIPLSEYNGSKELTPEQLAKQHVMSPLLKPKREVPEGYGSKNPKYQIKRAWDMASLTTESLWDKVSLDDRKILISNGQYECICFEVQEQEQEDAYKFLNNLNIIYDIGRVRINYHFVLLTKKYGELDPFSLFSYSGIYDIKRHMNEKFYIPIDNISSEMTFNQFKEYIEKLFVKPAKDMYSPRKFDRDI